MFDRAGRLALTQQPLVRRQAEMARMRNGWQPRGSNKRGLLARLDRATRDLNAILLAVAIGLAALDFTCYFAFRLSEAMPAPRSAIAAEAPIAAAPATAAAAAQPIAGANSRSAPLRAAHVSPAQHD
jgi:hypothetical protein